MHAPASHACMLRWKKPHARKKKEYQKNETNTDSGNEAPLRSSYSSPAIPFPLCLPSISHHTIIINYIQQHTKMMFAHFRGRAKVSACRH